MTEQTQAEQLDWKDIFLLIFGAGLVLAAIAALAVHFGYGDILFRAAGWAADEWRKHEAEKAVVDIVEGIANYFKHHPPPPKI